MTRQVEKHRSNNLLVPTKLGLRSDRREVTGSPRCAAEGRRVKKNNRQTETSTDVVNEVINREEPAKVMRRKTNNVGLYLQLIEKTMGRSRTDVGKRPL
jgi:hypothetical protein